jgi:hypothetical protein
LTYVKPRNKSAVLRKDRCQHIHFVSIKNGKKIKKCFPIQGLYILETGKLRVIRIIWSVAKKKRFSEIYQISVGLILGLLTAKKLMKTAAISKIFIPKFLNYS